MFKTIIPISLVFFGTYLTLAWFIFQVRNPTANDASFFTEFKSVVLVEKLEKFQGNNR